ncbi:MAG TPA: protein kinase [Thermoanaerobaculia bacterium]|nr:protein kinase [Thermoanaerobaculia bacterium]
MASDGDGGIPEDGDPGDPAVADPARLSGRTVSHFRIGKPLGSGGMGEVYEAEDIRLGRSVALKFLAPDLVRSPAAKARFLNEARAASALDHPNLCTILDVGESEDGLLFLAMPRYDGESLQRRIARGPLPIDQALDIAAQVARGLARAHEQGIVHRDVKPGNLFLTRDGVVKILDFGIAKLSGEVGPTRRGAILGTPSYMAPEQVGDDPVDARADIWSLGVVLYEMLTGRRPFVGGTSFAVVYAMLHEEPEPLTRLRPEVPEELERIVSRMLAKDPEQRYASMAELLADLRKNLGLQTTESLSVPAGGPRSRRLSSFFFAGLALAAVAIVAIAAGFLLWSRGGEEPAPQPGKIARLTDFQGSETSPSLSPDGKLFVYARSVEGNFDLFWQRVEGGSPRNLTAGSPADDIQPAFSPDGQQIAFRSEREGGGIFLMGATGESVRRLTDFGFNPAWSPDGREIAVATEGAFDPTARFSRSQIFRIDVATGERRQMAVPDGVQPSWSPQGLRIAFWGIARPESRRAIWTVSVDGGAPVTVVHDAFYNWSPVWSPDGRFLYFASDRGGSMNLWRVAVDERSGQVQGAPEPVTTSSEWSALPSLSRDGRHLVYATRSSRSFVELVTLEPETGRADGPPSLVYQGARAVRSCDISPDGAWLALRASSPVDDLFVIRPDGSELRQLTDDLARDRMPRWSPDGSRILFASNRSGKYEAWTIRPDGSGLTQITDLPDRPVFLPFWSPDGRRIGFMYGSRGTALLDLAAPRSPPHVLPPLPDGKALAGLSWSGDGRFLTGKLLRPDESTAPGVILWSLADHSFRRLTSGGADPMFLRRGTRILFLEEGAIQLADAASGERRTVLAPPPYSSYLSAAAGPEDRSLCTVRATAEGDIWSLRLEPAAR